MMMLTMIRLDAIALLGFVLFPLAGARPLIHVEDFFNIQQAEKKDDMPATDKKTMGPPPPEAADFFTPVTKGMPKLPKLSAMEDAFLNEWSHTFDDMSFSMSFSMSLSMSMSMSMKTHSPIAPVAAPSRVTTEPAPAPVPSYPTAPSPTVWERPTFIAPPTSYPVVAPGYPTGSAPTSTPEYPTDSTPTCSNCPPTGSAYACTANGIDVTETPNATTTVSFSVGYLVETSGQVSDSIAAVEELIVGVAVAGALQCVTSGDASAPTVDRSLVVITSTQTNTCTPTLTDTSCTIWQTAFEVTIAQDMDSSVALFLGYMFVQEEMNNGAFVDQVPFLDRISYLTPSPLLPPITGINGNASPAPSIETSSDQGTLSVSNWTLGAVLTMCVGGVIALAVWVRNRRTRNERHLQLMEDVSIATPALAVSHGRSED